MRSSGRRLARDRFLKRWGSLSISRSLSDYSVSLDVINRWLEQRRKATRAESVSMGS